MQVSIESRDVPAGCRAAYGGRGMLVAHGWRAHRGSAPPGGRVFGVRLRFGITASRRASGTEPFTSLPMSRSVASRHASVGDPPGGRKEPEKGGYSFGGTKIDASYSAARGGGAGNLARRGPLTAANRIRTGHEDGVGVNRAGDSVTIGWLQVVPGEVERRHHEDDQRQEGEARSNPQASRPPFGLQPRKVSHHAPDRGAVRDAAR